MFGSHGVRLWSGGVNIQESREADTYKRSESIPKKRHGHFLLLPR